MQFEIRNRFTDAVQFTAEIDCAADAPMPVKVGLAVRWAVTAKADLSEADLRGAYLREANLSGADLSEANLSGADLRGAPIIEDIHAKVYAAASQPGALDMGQWHCGTSHCRAGWVVTLAGKEGADLEAKIGTPDAAMAIYMVSDPERWKTERLPDFYCGNATALADMARMAVVDVVADLTDTAGR